jgi:hypothetical protein
MRPSIYQYIPWRLIKTFIEPTLQSSTARFVTPSLPRVIFGVVLLRLSWVLKIKLDSDDYGLRSGLFLELLTYGH